MSSAGSRFRAWVESVEFAVTAAAVAVALAVGLLVFETLGDSNHGFFVVILAGVGVPNIYDQQWERPFDRRLVGAAWAVVTSLALVACYLAFATGLRTVVGETAATITAFVTAWFLGIVGARAISRGDAQA